MRHTLNRWRKSRATKILGRGLRVGVIGLLLAVVLPLIGVVFRCGVFNSPATAPNTNRTEDPEPIQQAKAKLENYTRAEDQTYLTYPEWYIVYAADEYAVYVRDNKPSGFPYFTSALQYWQSYYGVCAVTQAQYPFNSGYHLSNAVTGVSFTIENLVKGIYENTLGRVSELFGTDTEEDAYAHKVAQEYGAFIHTIPWYEFPFGEKLSGLWAQPALGKSMVRKWERRLALSLEYGIKSVYGRLIKQGTAATYAPEKLEILAWAEGVSDEVLAREPKVRSVLPLAGNAALVSIPRYEEFTQTVPRLAKLGVRFNDIAGNTDILLTLFAPAKWQFNLSVGKQLFALPVPTQPNVSRVAIRVPVKQLHALLSEIEPNGLRLEHIYDY